jgi:hypothetical protein
MSHPIPATFTRIAAIAGTGSAAVLLVNAAKRAELIPTSAFTQLVAPLAQILALALVTALYVAFGRRAGAFGLVAYLLNAFALSALVASSSSSTSSSTSCRRAPSTHSATARWASP